MAEPFAPFAPTLRLNMCNEPWSETHAAPRSAPQSSPQASRSSSVATCNRRSPTTKSTWLPWRTVSAVLSIRNWRNAAGEAGRPSTVSSSGLTALGGVRGREDVPGAGLASLDSDAGVHPPSAAAITS